MNGNTQKRLAVNKLRYLNHDACDYKKTDKGRTQNAQARNTTKLHLFVQVGKHKLNNY